MAVSKSRDVKIAGGRDKLHRLARYRRECRAERFVTPDDLCETAREDPGVHRTVDPHRGRQVVLDARRV
jgi:hypothetical protein